MSDFLMVKFYNKRSQNFTLKIPRAGILVIFLPGSTEKEFSNSKINFLFTQNKTDKKQIFGTFSLFLTIKKNEIPKIVSRSFNYLIALSINF
jgi:hypothetical protein